MLPSHVPMRGTTGARSRVRSRSQEVEVFGEGVSYGYMSRYVRAPIYAVSYAHSFIQALPYLLDISLPPSPSYSISNTIPLSQLEAALEPPDVLDKSRYEVPSIGVVDPICLSPPLLLEGFSLRPSRLRRAFLSEGSSLGSVDWPPIGSSPLPAGTNVRLDEDTGVKVRDALWGLYTSIGSLTCTKVQENAILPDRKAPVSETEEVLDKPKSIGGAFAFAEDLKIIAGR